MQPAATNRTAAVCLTDHRIVTCFLAFAVLGVVSCSDDLPPQAQPVEHDSLPAYAIPLDDEPPLLLDDAMLPLPDDSSMALNARCFVCHLSYMQEELAVTHAREEISCAQCHGDSDAHIADESWASGGKGTAPDRMYAPQEVNGFCMECHAGDTLPEDDHAALIADKSPEDRCTDCHGEHLLKNRTTKWK